MAMQSIANDINLGNIITLLDRYDKQALIDVKNDFKSKLSEHELDVIITGSKKQGVQDIQIIEEPTKWLLKLELAFKGLNIIKERIEPNVNHLNTRLKRAKKIKFFNKILSGISSGTSIITLLVLVFGKADKAIIVGIINLVTTISVSFANYYETGVLGDNDLIVDSYKKLGELIGNVNSISFKYSIYKDDTEAAKKLIADIEITASQLIDLESRIFLQS
ncbi:hypothetical protein [Spirosoma sp. KNUC1025]|uniref:hypothetical protein n=1 Tax=Spirosoma sp. KNUC1025 TaxID=2894082 RepID=UPI0038684432|nr:hypothetical protein LN737_04495 [Spirosoma sp. KNUC1025]